MGAFEHFYDVVRREVDATSQKHFSQRTGLTRLSIQLYLKRENEPTAKNMQRVADATGETFDVCIKPKKRQPSTAGLDHFYNVVKREIEATSQNAFSKRTGLPLGSVQRYYKRQVSPSFKSMQIVADVTGETFVIRPGGHS